MLFVGPVYATRCFLCSGLPLYLPFRSSDKNALPLDTVVQEFSVGQLKLFPSSVQDSHSVFRLQAVAQLKDSRAKGTRTERQNHLLRGNGNTSGSLHASFHAADNFHVRLRSFCLVFYQRRETACGLEWAVLATCIIYAITRLKKLWLLRFSFLFLKKKTPDLDLGASLKKDVLDWCLQK